MLLISSRLIALPVMWMALNWSILLDSMQRQDLCLNDEGTCCERRAAYGGCGAINQVKEYARV